MIIIFHFPPFRTPKNNSYNISFPLLIAASANLSMYANWWFCRDGNIISSIPYPKVFGYLIPTLAAVVGANVQGTTKPLINTHRVSLCVFLVAIIIHYIAFAADKMSQRNQANFSQVWGLTAVTSGSLSAVALISTFCINSVAEIICYIALSCAVIIIVVYQCGRKFVVTCRRLYHDILRPIFSKTLEWFQANNNNISSSEHEQLPPV